MTTESIILEKIVSARVGKGRKLDAVAIPMLL